MLEGIRRNVRLKGIKEDSAEGRSLGKGMVTGRASSSREIDRERGDKGGGKNGRKAARIRAAFATKHEGWSEREAVEEVGSWVQVLGGVFAMGVDLCAEARGKGWQLTIAATRRQCLKLSRLPFDALSVGGCTPARWEGWRFLLTRRASLIGMSSRGTGARTEEVGSGIVP